MSADLSTRYLGLELSSPVVASASPLNEHVTSVRAVVDAGAAAIIMPSLFEEEVLHEQVPACASSPRWRKGPLRCWWA